MGQTVVNFKMDEGVKRKMESACIPFEVMADSFYSESNISVLEARAENIESGQSVPKEHELIEV